MAQGQVPSLFTADYPRPQVVRASWMSLDGSWEFGYDDDFTEAFPARLERQIVVPFPPESPASGVGERGFHPVVWYRRTLSPDELATAGWRADGDRLVLHFGAVDYRADVWVNDSLAGRHEGGHSPFSFDITDLLTTDRDVVITVRAEDDPLDVGQPRGKQDWQEEPHGIWYERTTGIWQPVWLEAVPVEHIGRLSWSSDLPRASVTLELELARRPHAPVTVDVSLSYEGAVLGTAQWRTGEPRSTQVISLPRQTNGQAYESLLWTPESPRLLEALVEVTDASGQVDTVSSYLGLRSVGTDGGHFVLNDRPYYVRSVLGQGYWPESHLAAPSSGALRAEVALTKSLGFNAIRLHQKVEDPRFLMWADRLGLMVWEEAPSHFEFSSTAVTRLTREWSDVVLRDRSHPSIVTWVPLNESWGVQHISHDFAQLDYAQALYHLTKALDPTRPVISNDGWEHAESDIMTIHDYAITGPELAACYTDAPALESVLSGLGPLGRRMRLLASASRTAPVMVSEFGGISFAPSHDDGTAWGYGTAASGEEFESIVRELFTALQSSPVLAGFCYTQLVDTRQESNGLADAHRTPKLAPEVIAAIVRGDTVDTSGHRRPRKPAEQPHDIPCGQPNA
ncbi:glycoside hydrolase family 2 protein [Ruania alba]|uniref:Glycosyl hydrolases family 2 n=1 Tax=Ruania alba TaxID=648782 RepID=A0A1H5DE28_9MICO|nr:glycoside hydrolase family 2 TIM barrel-domain containing protein [Ruania alba]SED77052.1 Glycosyl hydrolases family 2 [Ruania alba]